MFEFYPWDVHTRPCMLPTLVLQHGTAASLTEIGPGTESQAGIQPGSQQPDQHPFPDRHQALEPATSQGKEGGIGG